MNFEPVRKTVAPRERYPTIDPRLTGIDDKADLVAEPPAQGIDMRETWQDQASLRSVDDMDKRNFIVQQCKFDRHADRQQYVFGRNRKATRAADRNVLDDEAILLRGINRRAGNSPNPKRSAIGEEIAARRMGTPAPHFIGA